MLGKHATTLSVVAAHIDQCVPCNPPSFALTYTIHCTLSSPVSALTPECAHQGFTNPDSFDPDRFSPERKEDIAFQRNFLTFGCGPHYCVGREYAINHLTVFLAILSTSCDWSRRRTDRSDLWLYLPTIYPADSFITLSR